MRESSCSLHPPANFETHRVFIDRTRRRVALLSAPGLTCTAWSCSPHLPPTAGRVLRSARRRSMRPSMLPVGPRQVMSSTSPARRKGSRGRTEASRARLVGILAKSLQVVNTLAPGLSERRIQRPRGCRNTSQASHIDVSPLPGYVRQNSQRGSVRTVPRALRTFDSPTLRLIGSRPSFRSWGDGDSGRPGRVGAFKRAAGCLCM